MRLAGPHFTLPPVLPEDEPLPPTNLSDKNDLCVRYTRSYLLIRTVVGFFGVVLPLTFFVGEAFMARGVHFR